MCCPVKPPHTYHHHHQHLHPHCTLGHPPTHFRLPSLARLFAVSPPGSPRGVTSLPACCRGPGRKPIPGPPPYIYTKFLRRLGSSLHSFLKKPWHAKAIFWVPGCGLSAAARFQFQVALGYKAFRSTNPVQHHLCLAMKMHAGIMQCYASVL